jgi:multiple sugar transport system ATP-binding protein
MAQLSFHSVSKIYQDGTRAVSALNLDVTDGEFMVLVGPSGCGKTTALRMAGGLEQISEGEITIGDRVANRLGPRERDVAMVFQNYALYPHMSVFDNIAFPLRAQKVPRSQVKERVQRTASLLGLEEQLRRRPRNLSGGQRQRVAMGRALIRQPQVFLMDEPLSNLDAKLRVEMRAEITRLQKELGVTTIYVTHDQIEAMTMGHRIAVMRKGVLQQEGPPQQVYDRPANLFVAEFIGSPPMNLFRATLNRHDGQPICALAGQQLTLPAHYLDTRPALARLLGREIAIGVRPEHLRDGLHADRDQPRLYAEVTLVEALGPERQVHLQLPARPVLTEDVLEVVRDMDTGVAAELSGHAGEQHTRAIARFDPDAEVAAGETREIALAADRLRFFDLDTGTAIE